MYIGNFNLETNQVFIVAELSANHNSNIDTAIETIKAAKRAGANAIKLQTFTPDSITLNSNKSDFLIKGTIWDNRTLYDLYSEAQTPYEWHEILFKIAKELGLEYFSSPFDFKAVDLLEELNVPAYKIASMEITDIPLIEYVASKGKPIIISTGIATDEDIDLAISSCLKCKNDKIILLKCTSSYPAPIDEANLVMINDYAKKYNIITGLSDHTLGNLAPVVATVLGAKVIEKHFMLDKTIGGPDASFSMTEDEFKLMVEKVRETEKIIGKIDYVLTSKQIESKIYSRSLYISKDILKGQIINEDNVKSVRPGFSLHPKYYHEILGKVVNKDLFMGDRLTLNDLN